MGIDPPPVARQDKADRFYDIWFVLNQKDPPLLHRQSPPLDDAEITIAEGYLCVKGLLDAHQMKTEGSRRPTQVASGQIRHEVPTVVVRLSSPRCDRISIQALVTDGPSKPDG